MASFALLSDPHHNGCRECSAEAYFFQPWLVQCLCLSAEPAHTACTPTCGGTEEARRYKRCLPSHGFSAQCQ